MFRGPAVPKPPARLHQAPLLRCRRALGDVLDLRLPGTDVVGHGRVGDQHAPGNPPQQHAADGDDDGKAVHQPDDHLAAPDDDGHADQQAEDHQRNLMVTAHTLCSTGNGNHVVDAHHQVSNDDGTHGHPQLVRTGDVAVCILFFGQQQLDADPQQQQRAHRLQVGDRQQRKCKDDQQDAQRNGTDRPPDDALTPLGGVELAHGQGDDHRVVATQQDVDEHDLANGQPERGRGEIQFHVREAPRKGASRFQGRRV